MLIYFKVERQEKKIQEYPTPVFRERGARQSSMTMRMGRDPTISEQSGPVRSPPHFRIPECGVLNS